MQTARDVLTPDALAMLQTIASTPAALPPPRATLGVVPSALTYRVRQIEDALDVLLFDRSSRQARLTEAGTELLREGDAPADRDRRRGQPRQARGHRLGAAAHDRRGQHHCHAPP